MSTTDVFADLVDLLAETADAEQVLSFRLPADKQARLEILLDRNREGSLTDRERVELETFEQLEHVVRLLKAKMLARGNV
ncbi:MAG: hypothetical protein AAFU85_12025 [Planctomycetota bacterium]